MERQVREDKASHKKKNLAIKSTPTFSDDDKENEQDNYEEF